MDSESKRCLVCDDPSDPKHYCARCNLLRGDDKQMSPTARKARLDAMHEQWDSSAHAFRCHYTNVVLNHNEGSAWHAEWEHVTPDDDSTLVIAAGVVNRMKANLTVEQFRDMIAALNAYFFEGR